ncbi:MAG: DUF6864 domain-containing function [Myxococcota bacterium]
MVRWGWEEPLIESGPARVVDSGTVTTFAGHPLTLRWEVLEVTLVFRSDPAIEGPAVATTALDGGWRIECTNFDDATGRGSAEPVLLGERLDTRVFFHFRAFRYGRTLDHTVHYTVYEVAR